MFNALSDAAKGFSLDGLQGQGDNTTPNSKGQKLETMGEPNNDQHAGSPSKSGGTNEMKKLKEENRKLAGKLKEVVGRLRANKPDDGQPQTDGGSDKGKELAVAKEQNAKLVEKMKEVVGKYKKLQSQAKAIKADHGVATAQRAEAHKKIADLSAKLDEQSEQPAPTEGGAKAEASDGESAGGDSKALVEAKQTNEKLVGKMREVVGKYKKLQEAAKSLKYGRGALLTEKTEAEAALKAAEDNHAREVKGERAPSVTIGSDLYNY
jgi:chromosome segregation ATPase